MILKCANHDVMDLSNGKTLNGSLLPVASWGYDQVMAFLERRVFAQSNKIARRIDQRRQERTAYKLSLSDSYWISFDSSERFEAVSPYWQDFGTLEFVKGMTEPTLRLMGSFDKEWRRLGDVTFICKYEPKLIAQTEIRAGELAARLGVGDSIGPVFGGGYDEIDSAVFIRNLSSPQRMLLDFGSVLPRNSLKDGYIFEYVQALYTQVGFSCVHDYIMRVILFDAIIGNEDRRHNQGNWGFFKSTADGSVCLAPAYDFNLAYSMPVDAALLQERIKGIVSAGKAIQALDALQAWEPTVREFCGEYDYEVWHNNFKRLQKHLQDF